MRKEKTEKLHEFEIEMHWAYKILYPSVILLHFIGFITQKDLTPLFFCLFFYGMMLPWIVLKLFKRSKVLYGYLEKRSQRGDSYWKSNKNFFIRMLLMLIAAMVVTFQYNDTTKFIGAGLALILGIIYEHFLDIVKVIEK